MRHPPGEPGTSTPRTLVRYHAGYPDPAKNGHEILCLPRDRTTAQEAMALMAKAAAPFGPVQAGVIGIVEAGPG